MSEAGQGGAALAPAPSAGPPSGPPAGPPAGPGGQPDPSGPRTVGLPAAVLVLVATVVVALVAIAAVVRLDTPAPPTGPARDPGVQEPVEGTLTVTSGRAAYEELRVSLPGAPFRCGTGIASTPPPGLSSAVLCNHVVHADYDAKGSDWAAANGVGPVDDLYVRDDLQQTTEAVFDALYGGLYFPADHARLSNQSEGPETDLAVPVSDAYAVTGDVHVRRSGLTTPYDRLVVVVVRLGSGRFVAYFSDFPHDGSTAARKAVVASASSISTRR